MSDQQVYNHFGTFQLGDHQTRPYIILKKAPLKYYDDNCHETDKRKMDILFVCNGGDWQFVGSFLPAKDEEGLTEGMAKTIEDKF